MSERVVYIIIPTDGPPLLSLQSVIAEGRTVWVWDRSYTISTESTTVNKYLSAAAESSKIKFLGPAQTIGTEKEYHRIFKHWQAMAIVHHWYDCPRCGGFRPDNTHIGRTSGKVSRWDNHTMICDECGTDEAFMQQRGEDISPDGKRKWVRRST